MNLFKATNPSMTTANLIVMAAAIVAPVAIWNSSWVYIVGALLVWQFFNIVGISAGAHRYFSHRAFECNRFWQWVMAWACMASLTGPPCIWAEAHVRHHRFSDREQDPYLRFALGGKSSVNHTTKVSQRFLHKATQDPLNKFTLKYYWLFPLSYAALILLGAWVVSANPLEALFWLYLVPAGLSQLTLRFILWTGHLNSLGYRNFKTPDTSTNWWPASLIAAGEGWHNNHHAEPRAAKLGVRWWEFDPGWWFIRMIKQ